MTWITNRLRSALGGRTSPPDEPPPLSTPMSERHAHDEKDHLPLQGISTLGEGISGPGALEEPTEGALHDERGRHTSSGQSLGD